MKCQQLRYVVERNKGNNQGKKKERDGGKEGKERKRGKKEDDC